YFAFVWVLAAHEPRHSVLREGMAPRMRTKTWAAAALMMGLSTAASAQVVFTEIQPNLIGADDGEWFEIQNLGTSSVAIGGWTISDTSMGAEVMARWAFPATATITPGQV